MNEYDRPAARMRLILRLLLALLIGGAIAAALIARSRIARVDRAAAAIPVYPGAREGSKRIRYWPRFMAWDDRSSARADRVFAFPDTVSLLEIARHADAALAPQGWYLVLPEDLRPMAADPQVIMWQRDPDERLDLTTLWPLQGMTPEQRMHGGVVPAAFLDAALVFGWSWMLGGPRSARPASRGRSIVHPTPPAPSR